MDNALLNDLINKLDSAVDDSIPSWAVVIIECMKGIVNGLKVIDDLAQRINMLEDYKGVNEVTTKHLQDENKRLNGVITKLEMRVDDQEQRSRNMCLLIHGVPENDGEKTDDVALGIINGDLGINDIALNDIGRSHRLGPKKPQRNLRSNKIYHSELFNS